MDLSQLLAFYQVARSASFFKTAENLFSSQPALSCQVAALAKVLGLDFLTASQECNSHRGRKKAFGVCRANLQPDGGSGTRFGGVQEPGSWYLKRF